MFCFPCWWLRGSSRVSCRNSSSSGSEPFPTSANRGLRASPFIGRSMRRRTSASHFLALFNISDTSDIYEWLIGVMTANSRCSAAESPGLETQRREIESLLRECELRAGESWWESDRLSAPHIHTHTHTDKYGDRANDYLHTGNAAKRWLTALTVGWSSFGVVAGVFLGRFNGSMLRVSRVSLC